MKNLLSQLQDNDAILLMYLADELSQDDRQAVEQMLAKSQPLQLQLEQLRQTSDSINSAVKNLVDDAAVARAVRRTTSAMRQRHAELAARKVQPTQQARLPLPWWCYPLAAAAAIVLAAAVFFANMEPSADVPAIAKETPKAPVQDIVPWQAFGGLSPDPVTAQSVADEMVVAMDDSNSLLSEHGLAKAARDMESLDESSRASLSSFGTVME